MSSHKKYLIIFLFVFGFLRGPKQTSRPFFKTEALSFSPILRSTLAVWPLTEFALKPCHSPVFYWTVYSVGPRMAYTQRPSFSIPDCVGDQKRNRLFCVFDEWSFMSAHERTNLSPGSRTALLYRCVVKSDTESIKSASLYLILSTHI